MSQVDDTESVAVQPEELVLTPKLSPAWALKLWHLPVIAGWGLFFLLLNYLPLRPNDLWCHVLWGQWILDHRQLPSQDPFQPLAQGMPVVDTAWLSQVIFGAIGRFGGMDWLSNTYALVTLAAWLIIWRVLYLRSRSALASLLMVGLVWLINLSRLTTPRPENFAWLVFAVLWWLLVSDQERTPGKFRWQLWLGVPLVMSLWANLHGSFLVGLIVLATLALVEISGCWWRTRSLAATIRDPEVQCRVLVAEIALVATLINPYGADLHLHTVLFAQNSNLRAIIEWEPLAIGKPGGIEFVLSGLVATMLLRYSQRKVPLALGLLVLLLGATTLSTNRMIGWYALTFGVSFAPLLADVLSPWETQEASEVVPAADDSSLRGFPLRGRSWNYSLFGLLLLWIPFSLSPSAQPLLGGKPRSQQQLLGVDTPLGLTEYLRANPPRGQVFNPMWWGDWILWNGPPGIKPFMTTNVHLVPTQVWDDYLRVMNARPGWQQVLARYAVETILVDKHESPELLQVLRKDNSWQVVHEDPQCAVIGVRKPMLQPRSAPAEKPEMEKPPKAEAEAPATQAKLPM